MVTRLTRSFNGLVLPRYPQTKLLNLMWAAWWDVETRFPINKQTALRWQSESVYRYTTIGYLQTACRRPSTTENHVFVH